MTEEERGAESATEICRGCELPIHVKNLVFDGESNWHFKVELQTKVKRRFAKISHEPSVV